jgi:hypothetical protein
MSREFTQADAKAHACAYILLGLLQRMDQQEPGLIDELIAGAGRFRGFAVARHFAV